MFQFHQALVIGLFMPENTDHRMLRFGQSEQPVLLGYSINEIRLFHFFKFTRFSCQ